MPELDFIKFDGECAPDEYAKWYMGEEPCPHCGRPFHPRLERLARKNDKLAGRPIAIIAVNCRYCRRPAFHYGILHNEDAPAGLFY